MKDKEKHVDNSWRVKMVKNGMYKNNKITSEKKQIEEIAKIINNPMLNYCRELNKCKEICQYSGKSCREYTCRDYAYAETLHKEGYRKIDKDSVMLSREEFERLKRVEAEKDRLYEIKLDLENQLIEKGWTDYEGADEIENRVSKETTQKTVTKIKQFLSNVETIRGNDAHKLQPEIGYKCSEVDDFIDKIEKEELAK